MDKVFLYSLLILISTLISAISQVLLKKAALIHYDTWYRGYLNLRVISAYAIFFLATLMTVIAYRVVDVSSGTLLETSSYIFVFAFDVLFFHEKMTGRKLLGAALILIGIAMTVLL
ncbi:MAG: EamA family transporter [Clostridia bacterium]|nr:EamA family transporter [Clostridia bacterium]